MSRKLFISLAGALLPLTLAWSAAAGAGPAPQAYGDGPSCDLHVAHQAGGSLVLEGHVFAPFPVSGSYELEISQGGYGGSSTIHQGGAFEIAPGEDGSLGIVSLPASGGYAAKLIVHWRGGAPDCRRHAGSGRRL